MKRNSFIPLALTAFVLTGCTLFKKSGVNVKAPKFASVGDQINLDTFLNDFVTINGTDVKFDGKIIRNSEYLSETSTLSSKQIIEKSSHKITELLKRNNKENSKSVEASVVDSTVDADIDSQKMKIVSDTKSSYTYTNRTGKSTSNSSKKETYHFQWGMSEGQKCVLLGHEEKKEYQIHYDEDVATYLGNWLNYDIKLSAALIFDTFIGQPLNSKLSGEVSKYYTYYRNGSIYTIEFYESESEDLVGSTYVDGQLKENVKYAKYYTTDNVKMQFDFTGGKWSYKYSYERDEKKDYSYDYGDNRKDDIVNITTIYYSEIDFTDKDVKVDEADFKDYRLVQSVYY